MRAPDSSAPDKEAALLAKTANNKNWFFVKCVTGICK